jgi:chloramphenicol 3-O phosphotransferase
LNRVVFLNGPGSCGKTSVAKAMQHLSETLWLRLGVDAIFEMIPKQYLSAGAKAKEGLAFIPEINARGQSLRCESGMLGNQIFYALPAVIRGFLDSGNDLILDEVVLSDGMLKAYVEGLKHYTVYFVGIFCAWENLQERETLRKNRPIGLANSQMDLAHSGTRKYDLTLDSTHRSPFQLAQEIMDFIKNNPNPRGFKEMEKIFEIQH